MTDNKRKDEIDLIELFQKMGNGIMNLINKFLNLLYLILLFFIRKSIVMMIIVAAAVSYGYIQYKTSPRYYSSSLEAYSNAMSSIDMINYINNIHELFRENNTVGLKEKLGLDSITLETIKDVKAYKVIDLNKDGITDLIDYDEKYLTSDTTISHNRFVVKVEVFDQNVFPVIQESILSYIDENQYIKERNNLRKDQLEAQIEKLNEEIASLDSLKKNEYFTKKEQVKTQPGQIVVMNERETQLYHGQIMGLFNQKQALEETLKLRTDAITVIQDFSALSIIENNMISYIKKWGIIGVILALFISVIIENFKGITNLVKESKKGSVFSH